MPIYEYVCLDCQNIFEMLRSMKDADAPLTCSRCQSLHTSRMISLFNAQSGGRVVAGSAASNGCAACSASSCAGCGR